MSGIWFELLILFCLVLANGVLAMSEMAIVTAKWTRLRQRADKGSAGAQAALELAREPNRILSTVQIGITGVSILAGVFGGATLGKSAGEKLDSIGPLEGYGGLVGAVLVVVGITYLTLVVGELVPKRFALRHAETVASLVAPPMRVISVATGPLVWVLSASTELILRLLRVRAGTGSGVTEEEIQLLLQDAAETGQVEEAEQVMASRVFRLADRDAKEAMTPRTLVEWLDANEGLEANVRKMAESSHSAFPLCHEDFDQILGIVTVNDVLAAQALGKLTDLRRVAWQPVFVPETASLLSLLEDFKRSGRKIAVVIDEFGGAQGIVTLTDVLEEVVGDIDGMQPGEQPAAMQRPDGSWLLDGMLETEEFFEKLNLGEVPEDEDYQTLGGFVMTRLERVPREGEAFEWAGYVFEVMDMDGNRVDKVLATPRPRMDA